MRTTTAIFLLLAVAAFHVPGEAAGGVDNAASGGGRAVRDGVAVEFNASPVDPPGKSRSVPTAGELVDVRFRIVEEATGKPLSGLRPAGWMDVGRTRDDREGNAPGCREKIGLYLKGIVGIRPMLDLNAYFLLVLNRDPSISVIDPLVGMTGKTNLYATIPLKKPGADWAVRRDEKRLYVTIPDTGQLAVIDSDAFKVDRYLDVGGRPARVALQPDGAYIWVGFDGGEGEAGGVAMIDTASDNLVARIVTGKGHHEIAFSHDDRYAFVTNRSDGTVSVIDVRERRKVRDIATGPMPISLDYSKLARALYVADGGEGVVAAVDGVRHDVVARIPVKPGLGPLRITPDGRYVLAVNSRESVVHVIDASTNRVAHELSVGAEPYQIAMTRNFAHIRSLGTEFVSMINLGELGSGATPPVNRYEAGPGAPRTAAELGISPAVARGAGETDVFVANPANNTIYYYMEGMNAPMGNFRGYGHEVRGLAVVNRSLKETEPGVYGTRVKLPVGGVYDVAFILDSPRIVQCFRMEAAESSSRPSARRSWTVEYLVKDRRVPSGGAVPVRFRLIDPETGGPRAGIPDAYVLYYASPGARRDQAPAREVEPGVYEASLSIAAGGGYYVYVGSPSLKIRHADLPFLTLIAGPPGTNSTGGKGK